MRTLPNGDIVFPNRGDPPPDLSNYKRDPGDAFLFHPIWPDCKYREHKMIPLPCCPNKPIPTWHCQHFDINLCFSICRDCNVNPKT
jgi:hypothetical protein